MKRILTFVIPERGEGASRNDVGERGEVAR